MIQRNKERNICVSNIYIYIYIYLITSVLFLSIGSNRVYASGEIGTEVENGTIKINSDGISYEYKEKDRTETKTVTITDSESQPIQLSQETLEALFGDSKEGNLSFNYLVDSKTITETENINTLASKNALIIGENSILQIQEFQKLTIKPAQDNSVFAIMGTRVNKADNYGEYTLFANYNVATINTDYIFISGNSVYSNSKYGYANLFNVYGDYGSDPDPSLNLNGKSIIVESNSIVSTNKAFLFYILYDITLNLSANFIFITNNTISPTFTFDDNDNDKYSVVFYDEYGTPNINLYGNNPSFTLANNKMPEGSDGRGIIGVVMINYIIGGNEEDGYTFSQPRLNFINNSNTEAKITLGHDIRSIYSYYNDDSTKKFKTKDNNINSTITFKNSDGNNNGSFHIDLGTSMIEANTINLEANTTLLLAIVDIENNEEKKEPLVGNLKGVGNNSALNITSENGLTILIDAKNSKNVETDKSYIIISGFNLIENNVKDKIIFSNDNNEEIEAKLDYNSDNNTVAIKFSKFPVFVDEEENPDNDLLVGNNPNKSNQDIIEDMFKDYNIDDNTNINETLKNVIEFIRDINSSKESKASLMNDILPSTPAKTNNIVSTVALKSINNTLMNRISINNINNSTVNRRADNGNSNNSYSNNLIASANINNSSIRNKDTSTLELWSNIGYNYGYNLNDRTSINVISAVIGLEYSTNINIIGNSNSNNNLLLGLALNYSNANRNDYSAYVISTYGNINLDNNDVNSLTIMMGGGILDTKEDRKNNSINNSINHNHNTKLFYLTTGFNHNIRLANGNNLLTPKITLGYSYMIRDKYSSNVLKDIDSLSLHIITPTIGLDYQSYINRSKTLSLTTSLNVKYDFSLTEDIIGNNISLYNNTNNSNGNSNNTITNTLTYNRKDINNLTTELSLAISYHNPLYPNLKFSANGYVSYSTNEYINAGVGVEGRWRVR